MSIGYISISVLGVWVLGVSNELRGAKRPLALGFWHLSFGLGLM